MSTELWVAIITALAGVTAAAISAMATIHSSKRK